MSLLASGSNSNGQLGNGSLADSYTFQPCSFFGYPAGTLPSETLRIIQIASGANHTLVLLEASDYFGELHMELWGCGDGSAGQLGNAYLREMQAGGSSSIFRQIDISFDQKELKGYVYKLISASWETTYIVLSHTDRKDILISMGADDFGDLGVGGTKEGKRRMTEKTLHLVNFEHLVIDRSPLEPDSIIIYSLASGPHHVVVHAQAALTNGSVQSFIIGWGTSRHGQLGSVTNNSGRPVPFLSTPTVVSISGAYGSIVSVALGSQHTILLHASGEVSGLGSNRKGQLQGLEKVRFVQQVACTWNGTYVLVQEDGGHINILTTGSHSNGQLGRDIHPNLLNDTLSLTPVEFPITLDAYHVKHLACGSEHVLALFTGNDTSLTTSSTDQVWGWGWNEHGNLGIGSIDDIHIPVKIWPGGSLDVPNFPSKVTGIWAGIGTSWIYCTTH